MGRGSTPGPTRLGDAYFIGSPALQGVRSEPGLITEDRPHPNVQIVIPNKQKAQQ
jgi:hypothetical protein